MNKTLSTLILALTASLGAVGLAQAAGNPFAMQSLDGGYMVAADAQPMEGKCGTTGKAKEAKCGASKAKATEAKCGAGTATEPKVKEAKCGAGMAMEPKAKEGKCGSADMAKVPAGKCGGGK